MYKNVRNAKISDVTYMSRPVSARPKAAPAQQSGGSQSSPSSSPDVSFIVKGAVRNIGNFTITVEVLNNSSSRSLVRLDNITITYGAAGDYSNKFSPMKSTVSAQTVNIPPLGSKIVKYTFGDTSRMRNLNNIRVTATPRFGEAAGKSSGTTIIVK